MSIHSIADSRNPEPSAARHPVLQAAAAILAQGGHLLDSVGDDDYRRAVPVAFHASIGGHYRHCLDHFALFLDGLKDGHINYDHRERNPRTEVERGFAGHLTRDLARRFAALDAASLDRTVEVSCSVLRGGDPVPARSTVARELNYVVAHAIHHYALIAVIAGVNGVRLPREFGVAPSTLNHLDRRSAATASA